MGKLYQVIRFDAVDSEHDTIVEAVNAHTVLQGEGLGKDCYITKRVTWKTEITDITPTNKDSNK